jgi:hypothetical protein
VRPTVLAESDDEGKHVLLQDADAESIVTDEVDALSEEGVTRVLLEVVGDVLRLLAKVVPAKLTERNVAVLVHLELADGVKLLVRENFRVAGHVRVTLLKAHGGTFRRRGFFAVISIIHPALRERKPAIMLGTTMMAS